MPDPDRKQPTAKAAAKALILKLGVKRVAAWCGLSDWAVYQWFTRATDAEPVPVRHVAAIVRGAREEGMSVDPRVLWPEYPQAVA